MSKETIIVNSVFVGGYGDEKGNLPHEMINFFRSDNINEDEGNFYIYITPYGTLDPKLTMEKIKGVLFVRSAGDSLVEVLAKAVIKSNNKDDFYTQGITLYSSNCKAHEPNSIRTNKEEYKRKTDNKLDNIRYGGVPLSKIHEDNIRDNELYVTMQVSEICLPKKTFYLTHKYEKTKTKSNVFFVGENIFKEESGVFESEIKSGKKMANQSMKVYFEPETDGYQSINEVFDDTEELWKSADETPSYDSALIFDDKSFFKVTRQQDNEVMFSNMFYYIFSEYPSFTNYLFGKIQNKKNETICLHDDFFVEREKDRMDIRIIDSNTYIIVENKIKSSINGIHTEEEDKKRAENKKKNNKNESEERTTYNYKNGIRADEQGKYLSQLSEYYEKAKSSNKKILPYIFLPDYSSINEDYLKAYRCGEKYSIIKYSEILNCMNDYIGRGSDINFANDLYVKDFLIAMKKHTEPTDNEHRNELMLRLKERIDKYNKAK